MLQCFGCFRFLTSDSLIRMHGCGTKFIIDDGYIL